MAHSQGAPELEIRGIGWEQSNTHMIAFVAVHCNAAYLMKQWLQQAELSDLMEVVKTLTEKCIVPVDKPSCGPHQNRL